ncbi:MULTISPECIES: glutamine--fructose-6-phosphate transaminase (isomerizing) [Kocuria]|uniref:Glutamine--fructose-6-phosphate aminotransferase [isomerizing] n=1 Tax=Kocuria rhizophila (strain ATCC 9341 / DSM 348 / NBRC 103217 / DC2201) TaxID=378753 RepID=B2GJ29_KOCRD|nr:MULTISPECIES: glutamine--fructose-6-phosphate transaminase (isomerizing) [Kocuria]HAG63949.1 glutamine--fructose-6-phosphate transaminase (isomerizing) [Kocuria sp.]ASE11035.1 glutamine--fructose-6-phosphate transaminase (isomerizing) [Kocuria rhizophila]MCC5671190.1 glutamine--fructose-6-phosphate transaminase (isomerizing) [Kocuria rhizophila]MDV5998593.1 glutamine--fructose-6-phosphate transaminase (isomerizing) [Kocuria rhizophila]VEH75712.1 Glucosamine--fructose-6-phosphate aminotransf
MCGIVGYVGSKGADGRTHTALDVILEGLRRLEYRGYDSAGVAVIADGEVEYRKKAGKLSNLVAELEAHPLPDSTIGIGHTRWATHGGPSDVNAHPHVVDGGKLAMIHNGIIENFSEIKRELVAQGETFVSETDTEVAAVLLARTYNAQDDGHKDLTVAMQDTCRRLEGAFTLLAVHADVPDRVVAARRNSPLVIGLGEGENFLGSDVSGFIDYTKRAVEMGQDQIVTITADDYSIVDFHGSPAEGKPFDIEWDAAAAEKDGYPSFMEKEIHDQPAAVGDTLLGRLDENGRLTLDEIKIDESVLRSIDKIVVIACGTAAYAGQVARYAIEHWCRIPTEVELAHEFRYRDPIVNEKTLVVAVSQSGETMDTLMAVRHAQEQGAKVVAICNTNGSTIPREADAVLYTHAGPEIAVASTKAFLAQITAAYLLGLYLAQLRGNKYQDEIGGILSELEAMPAKIQRVLDEVEPQVKELATSMEDAESVLFLGRHVGYPVAMEGALKLKEIAYIHAEGFAAGELKHGPIALIDQGQPVIVIVPSPRGRDSLHAKVVSNIQEIRARGAETIVIAEEGDDAVREFATHVFHVPEAPTLLQPLLATVPLQIFACELAGAKGYDVDQPRNLAKSVTVE